MNRQEELAQAQEDEVLSLASIWPDQLLSKRTENGLELQMEVHVDLGGSPRKVTIHAAEGRVTQGVLEHLPPLAFRARLPAAYPAVPPELDFSTVWLADGSQQWKHDVLVDLQALWSSDACCIFLCIEMLQTLLSATEELHIYEPQTLISTSANFATRLANYNRMRQTSTFEESAYQCQICLEGRKGKQSIVLEGCHHVFCINCLRSMMEIAIADGLLDLIACPDANCAKRPNASRATATTIQPNEIKQIVGEAAFARYLWLVEKQRFDEDPTTSYCPRCQTPAVAPEEEDYATLRQCTNRQCSFVWCSLCHRSYHGVASCPSHELTSILNQYLAADATQQALLVKRHGKQLIKLALKHQDELAYASWIEDNSCACPNCRVRVEKSDGCNKMVCTRCTTFFCYGCGSKLSRQDPYSHYNSPSSPCYRMLFAGMAGTNDDGDHGPWEWLQPV